VTARGIRLALAATLAIAVASALAPIAHGTENSVGVVAPAQRPYRLNVARSADFVAQTNLVQCVGASMQMMLNMVGPNDRSANKQLQLQQLARKYSPPRPDGRLRKGASVVGWAAGLNELGAGPYTLVGTLTIDEALAAAAKAIRETGKPVGLLMWQGRHAWVMSGFEATGDPLLSSDSFRVTAAYVMDPLYPRDSAKWGDSPRPGERLTVEQLGKQFKPRRTGSQASVWLSGFAGMYVMVVPYRMFTIVRDGDRPGPARPI
jgi:hypothetical protein